MGKEEFICFLQRLEMLFCLRGHADEWEVKVAGVRRVAGGRRGWKDGKAGNVRPANKK